MAVLRPGRFRTGPVGTGEMLTSHAAPAAAVAGAFPMLIEMPLAKAGDQRRTGGCRGRGTLRQQPADRFGWDVVNKP